MKNEIFSVRESKKLALFWECLTLKMIAPTHFRTAHQADSVTSQNTWIFSSTDMRTSHLVSCLIVLLCHIEIFGRFRIYSVFLIVISMPCYSSYFKICCNILSITCTPSKWSLSSTLPQQNLLVHFLSPHYCHLPNWSDAPFDRPIIFAQQYKSWSFSLCCFIHPALILSLLVPDIFCSTQILDTLSLWPSFTPTWQRTIL